MKLLNIESSSEFEHADRCFIYESGIFAKPLDDHAKALLNSDKLNLHKKFEVEIKLDLPCYFSEAESWFKTNGFEYSQEELLTFKQQIKGIAHTKALRKIGSPSSYTDEQRNYNIVQANKVLDSLLVIVDGDLGQYTHLNVQKLTLVIEQQRVQKAIYSDEAERQKRLETITNKTKEIDWFLDDCPTNNKPSLQNTDHSTEESDINENNNNQSSGRREQQIKLLLKKVTELGLDPLEIPEGKKATIKDILIEESDLFTESGFAHTWKEANKRGVISIKNKEKYLKNQY